MLDYICVTAEIEGSEFFGQEKESCSRLSEASVILTSLESQKMKVQKDRSKKQRKSVVKFK